ncbi:MAG: hypothetical protein A3K68_07720, partial [Euryarchaeota archaeon RBG_16_68_13]
AIIASSNVIQSTFDYTIRSAVFRSLDHVDELLTRPAADGSWGPFDTGVFDGLEENRSGMPHVDGLAPRYQLGVSVIDQNSDLFEPSATAIGFDEDHELGAFVREDGTPWDGAGLAADEAILNRKLADAIEAEEGDALVVFLPTSLGSLPLPLTVDTIVRDEGRGAWNDAANLFVRLDAVQVVLGLPGRINAIVVSNTGGVSEGHLVSDEAVAELEDRLDPGLGLRVSKVKADAIEQSTQNVSQLSQLFTLLGSFTIIAGVLLIINIFVMLAEERKGEMGVARALGMRRSNLVQSFVAEGLLYALLSAAVGAFAGLLIAGVILWAFELVFPAEVFGGVRFVLTWTVPDLVTAFAIGFLITMATIALASWRISKLNIVRAIRDIPEPVEHRSTRRQLGTGAVLAGVGALVALAGFSNGILAFQDLGPCVLAIGLAVLLMRKVSPRAAFTAAGVAILLWLLVPRPVEVTGLGIELFVQSGLLLVLGGLLIVLFNSDLVLAVFTRILRTRTWRPVVRTAIAYPMNKKFRTGATLASIALVMFTIATMSAIQSMVSSTIETTAVRESGGFDLIAQTNPMIPKPGWDAEFAATNVSQNISEEHGLSYARATGISVGGDTYNGTFLGVPDEWLDTIPLEFQALDSNFTDGRAAWLALATRSDVAILDGTVVPFQGFGPTFLSFTAEVGDVLVYRNATGALREVRVIGILYQRFVQGIFVGWETVRADFGVDYPSVFYLRVAAGQDAMKVGHDLERAFVHYQMLTLDIRGFIDTILEVTMGVFNLLQAYLALGLIVGIAGLGVITMRNVVERRSETGALRALGFRKSMVLRSFLFELSFIALTGIAMGTGLGVLLSYDLWLNFFEGQGEFAIPWTRLAALGGVAFLGSVLATASPAVRASKMPPAEALRRFE